MKRRLPIHHTVAQHPQPRTCPSVVLRCLHYSTTESSPAGQKQNLHKGCQGCGVLAKCPAQQRAARCPASPWRSASAELHLCTEGKWRQDKDKLGKTNRHIKKACRLISVVCCVIATLCIPSAKIPPIYPQKAQHSYILLTKTPGAHQAEKAHVGIWE